MDQPRQLDLFDTGSESPGRTATTTRSDPARPAQVDESIQITRDILPSNVHLGTSSWTFPGWAGIVYDRGVSRAELARTGLSAYAKHPLFSTVGVDRAYYAPMGVRELRAYAESVPDDFRFLVKVFEGVTSARIPDAPRYKENAGRPSDFFLDPAYTTEAVIAPILEGLGKKAGPILFQFPPQDLREMGGPKAFVDELHQFLRCLPPGPLYAVELRNSDALLPEYDLALQDCGVAHCFNVHPRMMDVITQSTVVSPTAGPALVIRWMLGRNLGYEAARDRYAPFDRLVDPDPRVRSQIASLVAEAIQSDKQSFVIANNKAEGSAPLSALTLARNITTVLES